MSASFFSFPTAGAAARLHQCPQSLQRGTALVEGTGPLRGAVAAEAAAGCHGLLGRDGAVGGWMGLGLPDLVQFFSMNLFSRCCFLWQFHAIPWGWKMLDGQYLIVLVQSIMITGGSGFGFRVRGGWRT